MSPAPIAPKGRDIRHALARAAFADGKVRIADRDIADGDCLIATRKGLFAGSRSGVRLLVWGFFFGICRHGDAVYAFEHCDVAGPHGRVIRFDIMRDRLVGETVLIEGLDSRCHQIAIIDEHLCVIDTTHQAVRRFRLDGSPVDVRRPVPMQGPGGGYRHMNTIACVGDRIGLILHNGPVEPPQASEIVWLDRQWTVIERRFLPGRHCHDILALADGSVWHCGSLAGEIVSAAGVRIAVTDRMTRGLAALPDGFVVGLSLFAERPRRDHLRGAILYLDREFRPVKEMACPGSPTQLLALRTPSGAWD